MATQVDLDPPSMAIVTSEVTPITVEWADALLSGETIATPKAVMYDLANGIAVANAFQGIVGINGSQSQHIINGAKLQPNHNYRAIIYTQITGKTKILGQRLLINTQVI